MSLAFNQHNGQLIFWIAFVNFTSLF